jgi:hypothetical protein
MEGKRLPLAVFAAVLSLRAVYVAELSRTPLVHWNLWTETDEHANVDWSAWLAAGNALDRPAYRAYFFWQEPYGPPEAWAAWYQKNAYYSGPLYPYGLAVLRALGLPPVTTARLLQQLLAALAAAALAAATAARLRPICAGGRGGRSPAIGGAVAGLLYGLYAPLVFHDSFAYRDGPVAHLSALLLAVPLLMAASTEKDDGREKGTEEGGEKRDEKGNERGNEKRSARRRRSMAFFVGLLGGVAMLLKQTTAPLAITALYLLYSLSKKSPGGGEGRRVACRVALLGALGLALPLAALAARNLACGVPPLTFDTRQAIGLAWGNGRGADGSTAPAPAMKAILDEAKGGTSKTAWLVLSGYRDAPLELPKLYFRKLATFFNAFEVPDNASFYFFRDRIPLLRFLPVFACLLGAGLVGICAALSRGVLRRPEFGLVVVAFATPLAACLVVQTTSRYRAAVAAPLALGAGLLSAIVLEAIGRRETRRTALGLLAATGLVSLIPLLPSVISAAHHRQADAIVYATLVEKFVSKGAANAELTRYLAEGRDDPGYEAGEGSVEAWRHGNRDISLVAPEGVAPPDKRYREEEEGEAEDAE